jgi:4-amino-4-deoxy-L-arabinose transferase-like glycosyltransferase
MTTRRWLVAIVLVAAGLRFYAIGFGLPYAHARPDETTTLGLARQVRAGDFNPHSFHWGSLSIYMFAAVHAAVSSARRLGGFDPALDSATLVISARAAAALAGTLTVLVLFTLTSRMAGPTAGLLSACFLSVSILHVRESHFAMTDVLMTFFLTASLALLLEAIARDDERRPAIAWYAAAGLAGGLAASTKYSAAAVAAAMAAAQLVLAWRHGVRGDITRVLLPTAAFAAALLAGFFAGSPYALLDFRTFIADVRFESGHLTAGHGVDLGRGWVHHVTRSLPLGLGLPLFLAALAGIVPMFGRHPRQSFVLFAFAGAFYGAIGSGRTVFFRYVLPLVPLLCVAAAVLVRELSLWIAARRRMAPAACAAALAIVVAGPALVNSAWFDLLLARTDSRVVAARWLTPHLRDGETVYDNGGEYAQLDLATARVHHWRYDAASGAFLNANGRTPDWLVLHESPIDAHAAAPRSLVDGPRARYDLAFEAVASAAGASAAV